jgi:hypothetical protein
MRPVIPKRLANLTLLPALAALALAGTGCPGRLDSLAQFEGTEHNPLAFTIPDVHERLVSIGYPSEQTVVLFFNGPETSDAMQPITTEIAIAYRETQQIDFVNVVDLRSLSFYERPFAPNAIRGAHERTIRRINRRLEERELPPIEGLFDHLFIIADDTGTIVERYGVPDPDRIISCIVFDRQGRELGRFTLPDDLEDTLATIALSLGQPRSMAERD